MAHEAPFLKGGILPPLLLRGAPVPVNAVQWAADGRICILTEKTTYIVGPTTQRIGGKQTARQWTLGYRVEETLVADYCACLSWKTGFRAELRAALTAGVRAEMIGMLARNAQLLETDARFSCAAWSPMMLLPAYTRMESTDPRSSTNPNRSLLALALGDGMALLVVPGVQAGQPSGNAKGELLPPRAIRLDPICTAIARVSPPEIDVPNATALESLLLQEQLRACRCLAWLDGTIDDAGISMSVLAIGVPAGVYLVAISASEAALGDEKSFEALGYGLRVVARGLGEPFQDRPREGVARVESFRLPASREGTSRKRQRGAEHDCGPASGHFLVCCGTQGTVRICSVSPQNRCLDLHVYMELSSMDGLGIQDVALHAYADRVDVVAAKGQLLEYWAVHRPFAAGEPRQDPQWSLARRFGGLITAVEFSFLPQRSGPAAEMPDTSVGSFLVSCYSGVTYVVSIQVQDGELKEPRLTAQPISIAPPGGSSVLMPICGMASSPTGAAMACADLRRRFFDVTGFKGSKAFLRNVHCGLEIMHPAFAIEESPDELAFLEGMLSFQGERFSSRTSRFNFQDAKLVRQGLEAAAHRRAGLVLSILDSTALHHRRTAPGWSDGTISGRSNAWGTERFKPSRLRPDLDGPLEKLLAVHGRKRPLPHLHSILTSAPMLQHNSLLTETTRAESHLSHASRATLNEIVLKALLRVRELLETDETERDETESSAVLGTLEAESIIAMIVFLRQSPEYQGNEFLEELQELLVQDQKRFPPPSVCATSGCTLDFPEDGSLRAVRVSAAEDAEGDRQDVDVQEQKRIQLESILPLPRCSRTLLPITVRKGCLWCPSCGVWELPWGLRLYGGGSEVRQQERKCRLRGDLTGRAVLPQTSRKPFGWAYGERSQSGDPSAPPRLRVELPPGVCVFCSVAMVPCDIRPFS